MHPPVLEKEKRKENGCSCAPIFRGLISCELPAIQMRPNTFKSETPFVSHPPFFLLRTGVKLKMKKRVKKWKEMEEVR